MTTSQSNHGTKIADDVSRPKMANEETVMMSIGKDIFKFAQNRKKPDIVIMHPVRGQLRKLKPEHYDAEEFSFGLFNGLPLDTTKKTYRCKLAVASVVLKVMGIEWPELCDEVVPEPTSIQDLYELGSDTFREDTVKSVLTLDAVFLACFLGLMFYPSFKEKWPAFDTALDSNFAIMIDPLLKDLFKVENQIPLSLLHNVLRNLVKKLDLKATSDEVPLEDEILLAICKQALGGISRRLPGWALSVVELQLGHSKPIIDDIKFPDCQTFLDCMYRMTCPVEQQGENDRVVPRHRGAEDGTSKQPGTEERRERKDHVVGVFEEYLPSVTELQKANIKCKGRKGKSLHVEFKKKWHGLGATLYLPTLKISDDTEPVWRNLVAYEECLSSEGNCGRDFTHYLELMEKLIDTPNDVMLLKSGRKPVILEDGLGSNEAVARIFNNTVLQNCYHGERYTITTWDLLHHQIYDFYKPIYRKWWWDFYEIYFSKPWTIISVLVATSLFAATVYKVWIAK